MKSPWAWLAVGTLGAGLFIGSARADYAPSSVPPPAPAREFRAAWVATVKNIDWPSKAGLSAERQKAELLAILERAAQLKLNALFLQVRPACDAFYASNLEPWSEYLTGRMGQAPSPFYDPLEFAVSEAHKRGLELHAWFNPYRARAESATSPVAASHISRTQPRLVKTYGKALWLDPGEKAVPEHALKVILDVVRRYDVDGVHLDDYFYPYPVKNAAGRTVDFPDGPSWKRYQSAGGKMARADWRRANVDGFIERLYRAIKREKPAVKLGLSPFGIWRPGHPATIRGLDAYEALFADSRKWLMNGWADYFSPQLYWRVAPPEQSYPVLLKWWVEQNPQKRHLWPGVADSRIGEGWPAEEIVNQVRLTRKQPGATGNVHWSVKSLMADRGGIAGALLKEVYAQPALPPVSPWLEATPPARPKLVVADGGSNGAVTARWEPNGAEAVRWWVLQTRRGREWSTEIVPGRETGRALGGRAKPDVIAVTAVDRCGNASAPVVVERRMESGSREAVKR